nr:MAG TPA: hypothetical protein [Caudoviricetes sp.]
MGQYPTALPVDCALIVYTKFLCKTICRISSLLHAII